MGIRQDRAAGTRPRLLEAARQEFQRHGFAGARVDAIADAAGLNKRMIYAHFGSKAGLFETVLADNVDRVAAAVEFTPHDLPGYAVRLFDYWNADATSVRLFSWRNIEVDGAPASEDATYREMIRALDASGVAASAGLPAGHLLALVFAVLLAWAIPAEVFQRAEEDELLRRQESIRLAVERIVAARVSVEPAGE